MGHSEKDCQSVLEEDKCEKLGWHLGLKATPRKGRTKEIEEESKFRHCKKILFDAGCAGSLEKNEAKEVVTYLNNGAKETALLQENHLFFGAVGEEGNNIKVPPVTSSQVEYDTSPHVEPLSLMKTHGNLS